MADFCHSLQIKDWAAKWLIEDAKITTREVISSRPGSFSCRWLKRTKE